MVRRSRARHTAYDVTTMTSLVMSLSSLVLQLVPGQAAAGYPVVGLGPGLTHLTVDGERGSVYVAGQNRLYQLDPHLQLMNSVATGPVNDSDMCDQPPPAFCVVNRTSTDNYVKVRGFGREYSC